MNGLTHAQHRRTHHHRTPCCRSLRRLRRPAAEARSCRRSCTHLHDFVREVKLTEAEWMQGIEFLTAHRPDVRRQAAGVHPAVRHAGRVDADGGAEPRASARGATEATVFGPFHVDDAPRLEQGADIAGGAPGEPLFVRRARHGARRQAVAGAEVDVWQADEEGLYDVQRAGLGDAPRRAAVLQHRRRRPPALSRPSCRRPIRSRPTGRSAACWSRAAAIRGGRRTCTS